MIAAMKRREFITLVGGAAAWPLAARAQQSERMRRVGVLTAFAENDRDAQAYTTAFRQALEKLGWAAGRNVRIDYRWGGAEPERIRTYAVELVGLKPDVILAVTAQALQPLQKVTSSIPIVGRSDRQRLRHKHGASGWQHHWIHPRRILNAGQKTGDAQGGGASDYARGRTFQSGTNSTGGDVACS